MELWALSVSRDVLSCRVSHAKVAGSKRVWQLIFVVGVTAVSDGILSRGSGQGMLVVYLRLRKGSEFLQRRYSTGGERATTSPSGRSSLLLSASPLLSSIQNASGWWAPSTLGGREGEHAAASCRSPAGFPTLAP